MSKERFNVHSQQAWEWFHTSHKNKTVKAAKEVYKAKEKGLTATELSEIWGEPEHRSCGSALSRARVYFPFIVYHTQWGSSHGRYYHIKYAPKEEVE